MSLNSRLEYLAVKLKEYGKASRKERSALLDEMVRTTGMNRKYVIQLMNKGGLTRGRRQRERGRTYGEEVEAAVLFVAECLDFICGKRLRPALLCTALSLERHGEMILCDETKASLAKISASTIDRIYARNRERVVRRLPRRKPTRPSQISQVVPMYPIPWGETEPGHLEIDLVHHCGRKTEGDYVYTMQAIDVATGWSERHALLGKSTLVMKDALEVMNHRLPFPVREVHTDNGSEFLNEPMLRFWQQMVPSALVSRNRPWRKNDSRFVEQKNFTLVRSYVGYKRYDSVAQTWALNLLYERLGLYYNLFQPVMRIEKKILIEREGRSHVKRLYDEPRTPLDRLAEANVLSSEQTASIHQLRDAINLRTLKAEIEELIGEIKDLPNAPANEPEDVWHTLSKYRPKVKKGEWVPRLDYQMRQPSS